MDFPAARRKVNTYGKGARKIRVHDLFDVGAQSTSQSSTPPTIDAPTPPRLVQDSPLPQNKPKKELHSSMVYPQKETKATSTATPSPLMTASDSSVTFDIHSSDDESRKLEAAPPLKKRKVVSAQSNKPDGGPTTMKDATLPIHKTSAAGHPITSENGRKLSSKSAQAKPAAKTSKIDKPAPVLKRPVKHNTRSPPRLVHHTRPTSPHAAGVSKTFRSKEFRISSSSSAELSDASTHSHKSRSTPKRKRGVPDKDGTQPPSPSDLHLTSLRLTPGSGSQRSLVSSEDEEMRDAPIETPRKGRTRLIDRLDAPRTQSADASKPAVNARAQDSQSFSHRATGLKTLSEPFRQEKDTRVPEKQSSGAMAQPTGRVRATYAKQRSYLSDMVDGLDILSPSDSQNSSQQSHSQPLSFTGVASQMDLDNEDSDEPDASSQIKSIHELRRGGAVRKFDLDMQSLLEEVDSESKSIRIPALQQLGVKLTEHTFLRHFQDSGSLHRLIGCAKGDLDIISAALLAIILQSLVPAESSSPRVLLQILNALYRLPPRLLSETRSLSTIAKERSQNLSKRLIRDVAEGERKRATVLEQPSLTADQIYLRSIESTLRKLITFKEPLPKMPRQLLDKILLALTKAQEDTVEGNRLPAQMNNVRLLLSLLEVACANHELAGSSLPVSRLHDLGEAVAGVMREARQSHPDMEHSCLRLIVSLSNNDEEACGALSKGDLISSIFQVVDDHFLTLAGLAALEKEFDNAQLESVILAVGCLLNLAECADGAREKMMSKDEAGKSVIVRLVDIFNSHVDQATEVWDTSLPAKA